MALTCGAPEGIRTPNLLIRRQKRRAFSLFQGIPRCADKYVSPAQTVSRHLVVSQMCHASCDNGVTIQPSGLSSATTVQGAQFRWVVAQFLWPAFGVPVNSVPVNDRRGFHVAQEPHAA